MHVEVLTHPLPVVVLNRAQRVEVLATQHVHEESSGLFDVGDGDADVVKTTKSRHRAAHGQSPLIGSPNQSLCTATASVPSGFKVIVAGLRSSTALIVSTRSKKP